jgi:hypothetical protein
VSASPILHETIGLIRAAHLFARNYLKAAPPLSKDRSAVQSAFKYLDEALIGAMRKAINEHYVARDPERERFIKDEIARLEIEDWEQQTRNAA